MDKQNFETELEKIEDHINQFSLVIDIFSHSLGVPLFYDSGIKHAGFRYTKPSIKHFCVLKAVRAISALNACVLLAKGGFNQELCVLVRTIIEHYTQIEFMLAGYEKAVLNEKQQKILDLYFSDFKRNDSTDFKGASIRQEDIHKAIDNYMKEMGVIGERSKYSDVSTKQLMSNIYKTYSNYVHARYPEVMDMYGGTPPRFHMKGMSDTPKDYESLKILGTFTNSISIALSIMIAKFEMKNDIAKHPDLKHWIKAM